MNKALLFLDSYLDRSWAWTAPSISIHELMATIDGRNLKAKHHFEETPKDQRRLDVVWEFYNLFWDQYGQLPYLIPHLDRI